jgi:hypothetical protein
LANSSIPAFDGFAEEEEEEQELVPVADVAVEAFTSSSRVVEE